MADGVSRVINFPIFILSTILLLSSIVGCEENSQIGRVIRQVAFSSNNQIPFQNQNRFSFQPSSVIQGQFRPITSSLQSGNGNQFGGCNCVLLVTCQAQSLPRNIPGCSLPNGATGVCCPPTPASPPWGGITRLFSSDVKPVPMQPLSSAQLNHACHKGVSNVNEIQDLEQTLMQTQFLKKGDPAREHQRFFEITRTARDTHRGAMAISLASESMKRDFQLTNEQGCIGLRQFSARNTILGGNCHREVQCAPQAKYRTIDGSCNNQKKTLWGKSETSFQRILPAKYDDGIRAPRQRSVIGGALPNVRTISNSVLLDLDNPNQQFTLSVMQWGQFIDHDLALTPFASFENNEAKECCKNGQLISQQPLEDCWPIVLPPTDEFYASRNQKCFNFVRSMLAEDEHCGFGCAEQMNQVTHWLDGSNIYGSNAKSNSDIRDFSTGLLKLSANNMLPIQLTKSVECEARGGATCYQAGDSRVNEQPGLLAIHTIWHREHNRVANILRQVNPQWNPEAIFQEARRIVIAEYQHIIFNEWLPIILGEQFMNSFDIMPKGGSYNLDYNPNIKTNVNNEFATAAFRFGHTLVQGTMKLFSRQGRQSTLRLKEHFNDPQLFQRDPGMVDQFARTFTHQSIQSFDSFITKDLSNHLFETPQTDFGLDLMSLNLHRGRDHAIGTYNEMRVVCGLPRAKDFNGLLDQIPEPTVRRIASVYRHVDDIDFFVGGISEKPVAGGLLGWTFLCVVGDEFARVKKGDRYFYDLGGQPGSFRPEQLNEIRKASWARILCDNTKMASSQPLAFRLPQGLNQEVPCNSPTIPQVDLRFWRNERV